MIENATSQKKPRRILPPNLDSLLPTGAANEAVVKLGRRIVNGEYSQDELIPTEPELAESLGVSRTTTRAAIKVLTGKGMVRTARRYGTKVRPIENWNLLDPDVISWHDPKHERMERMFVETTELRCIIEPAAAELAADRATLNQVQTIQAAANALHDTRQTLIQQFESDCLFHTTILDATGNLMIGQLRPIIRSILRISYEFGVQVVKGVPTAKNGHIKVASAIANGNSREAKAQMEAMLEANRKTANAYWHDHSAIK